MILIAVLRDKVTHTVKERERSTSILTGNVKFWLLQSTMVAINEQFSVAHMPISTLSTFRVLYFEIVIQSF